MSYIPIYGKSFTRFPKTLFERFPRETVLISTSLTTLLLYLFSQNSEIIIRSASSTQFVFWVSLYWVVKLKAVSIMDVMTQLQRQWREHTAYLRKEVSFIFFFGCMLLEIVQDMIVWNGSLGGFVLFKPNYLFLGKVLFFSLKG